MPVKHEESASIMSKNSCLDISLQSLSSRIRASDGREIPFTRAVLTLRNVCEEEVLSVLPHVTLGQEGGTVQDVSGPLSASDSLSIPPGGTVSWDVYDTLLPAHPGSASKIHMFGYRAALNWRFDLAAWAEYRASALSASARTPISRWALRWSVADPTTGNVELTIEDLSD
jgi:hypothetical protein